MELVPYKKCGELSARMPRSEVERIFENRWKVFRPASEFNKESIQIDEGAFAIFFDSDNCVDGMELYQKCDLRFNNVNLFPERHSQLVQSLKNLNVSYSEEDYGYSCLVLGIESFNSHFGEPEYGGKLNSECEALYISLTPNTAMET
jgi:hypothetical protein